MIRFFIVCLSVLVMALSGCANISSTPLDMDGITELSEAASGFRYFLPRPYLLVTEIPAATSNQASPGQQIVDVPPPKGFKKPPGAAAGGGGAKANSTDNSAQPASQSPAPTSDTSFVASSPTYMAKVIYLPDYSRPMAVEMQTGLFGTASVQMTLQDGWMLTGVSANADNSKLADVVTAALQAIGSASSGGATKAASTAANAAKGGAPGAAPGIVGIDRVLAPGLYAFDYTYGQSRIGSVCAVAYFDSNGSHPTKPADPGACGPDLSRLPPPAITKPVSQ